MINPTIPPYRLPSTPLLPNTISLNFSVSETNPIPAPSIRLAVNPNGPVRNPTAAPRPILGSFCFKIVVAFLSFPSSPKSFLLRSSFAFAKPTADPTSIPAIGPPGTNGSTDVIPPTIAPLAIFGKYLSIFCTISLDISPSPSLVPSSNLFPNNQVWSFSLLDNIPTPAPTAAPKIGPPANPRSKDNPAPVTPPAAIRGR